MTRIRWKRTIFNASATSKEGYWRLQTGNARYLNGEDATIKQDHLYVAQLAAGGPTNVASLRTTPPMLTQHADSQLTIHYNGQCKQFSSNP
jgi:hypothetical protein